MSRVKPIAGFLILVLLIAAAVSLYMSTSKTMYVTADFQRVTGLYSGSNVRMLGVKIGKIKDIQSEGTFVRVKMQYSGKYRVPANASAMIVPPSLVADRYVQLAPVYRGGPVMADHAIIPMTRTEVPVELSTVLKSLDDVSVALGPDGANKDGALNKLLAVSANNLRGNGQQIHSTINDVSTLLSTLADNKTDLVGTVNNLDRFVHALRNSDGAVRTLTQDLASVSKQLSGDRANLSAALSSLSVALGDVAQFVRENRDSLTSDVRGLAQVSGTLLKQKQALSEFLDVAPLAIQNLDGAFDPEAQALRVRSNFQQFQNPQLYLCNILASLTGNSNICTDGSLPGLGDVVGKLPTTFPTLPAGGLVNTTGTK